MEGHKTQYILMYGIGNGLLKKLSFKWIKKHIWILLEMSKNGKILYTWSLNVFQKQFKYVSESYNFKAAFKKPNLC